MSPIQLRIYLLVHGTPPAQEMALRDLKAAGPAAVEALAREVQRLSALAAEPTRVPPELSRWLEGIADSNPEVRERTAAELGRSSNPAATGLLTLLASDPDAEVRREAIRSVGRKHDPDTVEILTSALRDPDFLIPTLAAEALAELGPVGMPALIAALNEAGYEDVRRKAVRLLGRFEEAAAEEALLQALGDFNPEMRVAALTSLAILRTERGAAATVRALADPNALVWHAALEAVLRMGDRAIPALCEELRARRPATLERCLSLLETLAERAPGPALRTAVVALHYVRWKVDGPLRRRCVRLIDRIEHDLPGLELPIPAENRLDPTDLPRPSEA